jgi:alpha-beta hydrolase superfamily lysophospholipase
MEFGETKCDVLQADEKTRLLIRSWLPDKTTQGAKSGLKAVFLAIHGGMAHAGDWAPPALYFKEQGMATCALDLRWHGTYPQFNEKGKVFFHTNSYDENTQDVHKLYQWIKSHYPGVPVFVLAHSNGALIALKYGLTLAKTTDIKGFILSSPWLKNKVPVPPILLALSHIIAFFNPVFEVNVASLLDKLTHDPELTARHHENVKNGLRGTTASARLGVESLKTQRWVIKHLTEWERFPLFCILAGQDELAEVAVTSAALKAIRPELLTTIRYEENYHENFNELNRIQVYKKIEAWLVRNKLL